MAHVRASGLLNVIPSPELEDTIRPRIEPVPCDFLALFEKLYAVSCDPHGNGYRDVGNPQAGRTDVRRLLPGIVADRRAQNTYVNPAGVEKFSSGHTFGAQPARP